MLVILAAGAFIFWWGCRPKTTTGDVRERINRNLQPGATKEEIFAFLDETAWEHDSYDSKLNRAGSWSALRDRGIPGDRLVIGAIIRDTGPRITIGCCDISVLFILDENQLLDQVIVENEYTLP